MTVTCKVFRHPNESHALPSVYAGDEGQRRSSNITAAKRTECKQVRMTILRAVVLNGWFFGTWCYSRGYCHVILQVINDDYITTNLRHRRTKINIPGFHLYLNCRNVN